MSFQRSVIVTGGTMNLGYHAALKIAQAEPTYLVVLASRSDKENAAETINKTLGQKNTIYLPLDLDSGDAVRAFARDWAAGSPKDYPPIQALLLNAGLQFQGPLKKNAEGVEPTFAVNHIGHALLFHLLRPHLAPGARVVLTSSGTHDPAQKSGLPDAIYTTAEDLAYPPAAAAAPANPSQARYPLSKLANVMWAYALHRRLQSRKAEATAASDFTVTVMDPGLMPGTGLGRDGAGVALFVWLRVLPRIMPLLRLLISPNIHKPEVSGDNLASLAVGADVEGVSGKYFEGRQEIKSSKDSYDEKMQDDLWDWTVKYITKGNADEAARFNQLK